MQQPTNPMQKEEWEDNLSKCLEYEIGGNYYLNWDKTISFLSTQISLAKSQERQRSEELVEALLMMYRQYCSDGHCFMSAGEYASTALETQGYATFDDIGRIVKITNRTALTEKE